MSTDRSTRRRFLQQAALSAAALTVFEGHRALSPSPALAAAIAGRPIRLGAPVFKAPQDPDGLALAHKRLGYRAAYCPNVGLQDKDRIRDYRAAFARHDIVIAEVGRWVNLLDADPARRQENLQRVTEGLALAEEIGARCCVDITGSFNAQRWDGPHPDNLSPKHFDACVENARKVIDAVKPRRAKFCFEMMGWMTPDSPDSYLELIKAVDREGFGVHLDPCNLINSPKRFYGNTQLLEECFDKLGPWIASCHAKDLAWVPEMNVHFQEVTLGAGSLDYATYLKRLAALKADVPLMIEHMKGEAEYDKSREHLLALAPKAGVRFN